jgi:hypothetical protein
MAICDDERRLFYQMIDCVKWYYQSKNAIKTTYAICRFTPFKQIAIELHFVGLKMYFVELKMSFRRTKLHFVGLNMRNVWLKMYFIELNCGALLHYDVVGECFLDIINSSLQTGMAPEK